MKISINLARYALGLAFILFGLNKFFWFLPMPTPPEAAGALLSAMGATGYMLPLLGITYIVSGVMLVTNAFVPLALLFLIAPLVNIVLFHLFLDPAGGGLGFVLLFLELFLAWGYRDSFRAVLTRNAAPNP